MFKKKYDTMRVFLIIPTLKQGGAERVISILANNFSQLEYEVHLILLAQTEDFYSINEEVIIHRLGFQNRNVFQKKISELNTFIKLRKLMKQHRPETILSFMDKYNVLTILSSSFLNLKVFVSDRSNPKKKIDPALQYLKNLTYKYATGIVAQTFLAQETLFSSTKNSNIKVIPNPLKEIKVFPEIIKENIILNIGRLTEEKGQKYLIEAFSKLDKPNWKLVILGDGELRQDLETQILELNLNDKVVLAGSVKNVDEYFARASIFAFSSVSEGFPNALVEAMASGLPCVSFDCDAGPRDIIRDKENGFLIGLRDVNAMASTLNFLCDNAELRKKMGDKASNIIYELKSSKITQEYLDFFNQ